MKKVKEIRDYDENDVTSFIDKSRPRRLADIGIKLPKEAPTRVISIRIPTGLYNNIRAHATNMDVPYQAMIKVLLEKGIRKENSRGTKRNRLRKTA